MVLALRYSPSFPVTFLPGHTMQKQDGSASNYRECSVLNWERKLFFIKLRLAEAATHGTAGSLSQRQLVESA